MAEMKSTESGGGPTWERIEIRLMQAEALATILRGDGGEQFRLYNHDIQENVMGLLGDTISEALLLLRARELIQRAGVADE